MKTEIEQKVFERVKAELIPLDCEKLYRDFLDKNYSKIEVAGVHCLASVFVETHDETAFRCGVVDFIDSMETEEIAGETYDANKVQTIREEIENQVSEN